VENERLLMELGQVWSELSAVMRAVYHLDHNNDVDNTALDVDRLAALVNRQMSSLVLRGATHLENLEKSGNLRVVKENVFLHA